jgi:ABC-type phosphate transport system substrate-binding protein
MRCKHIVAVLGTAALASISIFGAVSPASADPVVGTYSTFAGTGSDTTQDVLNGLANPGGSLTNVASYDAVGTPTIQVSSAGSIFNRPVGSGNGIKALSASIDGGLYPAVTGVSILSQLSFARSSRGPAVALPVGTPGALTFIPFARDGVDYAYNGTVATLGALTVAQLKQVYSANTPAEATVNGVQTYPIIPQAGSGTRAFFLGAIGVTTLGSQVSLTTPVENQTDGIVTTPGQIVPFSAASWIAQSNGVAPSHITTAKADGTTLGTPVVDGLGTPVSATLGTTTLAPSPAYFSDPTFGRDVYNVVETARLTGGVKADAALVAQFAGSTSAIASPASATIINKYGFMSVTYVGDTDINAGGHALAGALEK